MYAYEAEFRYVPEDSAWYVDFPDFDGAFTDGSTLEEAVENAAEVLQLFIASSLDRGEPLPKARYSNPPKHIICVDVDDELVRRSKCMSVGDAAEELGVTPGRVSQLLSSGQLEAYMYGGTRLVTIASVMSRKASKPPAHRPPKAAREAVTHEP